ncbi:MAG: ABC transporter substrate-binding protein [Pseudomonadota bacterium]|nr:ABC transporter substrate-binding protein [Pseudomonadota bacterium]
MRAAAVYASWCAVLPLLLACGCLPALAAPPAAAPGAPAGARAALQRVEVIDDAGVSVRLPAPAQRIVSLSPHATELLFAAGAGAHVVAVSRYSDFPPAARALPQIGDSAYLDLERLAAMRPDLVVAWGSALSERNLAALRRLGVPVFRSEPHTLDAIAHGVEQMALLAGTAAAGMRVAQALRLRIAVLRAAHQAVAPLSVFVQVWAAPLMTINRSQAISDALASCGASNVFAAQRLQVPTVDAEAVVAADPAVIVATWERGQPAEADAALAQWRRFPTLRAVAARHLLTLDADLIGRPGPRFIDATERLCRALDQVRAGLPLAEPGADVRP